MYNMRGPRVPDAMYANSTIVILSNYHISDDVKQNLCLTLILTTLSLRQSFHEKE